MAILMYVNCTCVYVLLMLHAVCKLRTNGNRFYLFSVQERAVCARSMVRTGRLTVEIALTYADIRSARCICMYLHAVVR